MKVYRDAARIAALPAELAACWREWDTLVRQPVPPHSKALELLLAFGELETVIADRAAVHFDAPTRCTDALRCIALSTAHLFRSAWNGAPAPPQGLRAAESERAFRFLMQSHLPGEARVRIPEGYAYYALHPATYLAAGARFADATLPGRAVCIGLRSIGTSLSAVVAAELESRSWAVRLDTLRPRGNPFDRRPVLGSALMRAWAARADSHFLLVDEGPGLSGSSLTGCAATLSRLGIPDQRIALFPSWDPPPEKLNSPSARLRWPRHRRFPANFEESWLAADRLGPKQLHDLSAGAWRQLFYPAATAVPAVQPYHERRKYLTESGRSRRFLKFVGLGAYGRPRLERAQLLADAGFAPAVHGFRDGFLSTAFLSGRPLTTRDAGSPRLADATARYLAFLGGNFAATTPVPFDADCDMIRANLAQAIGPARELDRLERWRSLVTDAPAVAIDGRMLPHEWILGADGYRKTDHTDHHDDHFFPGCQDLAWDVAGHIVEFGFTASQGRDLVELVTKLTRDRTLPRRVKFYRLGYLAYRVGYATLALDTLGATPDGRRFGCLLRDYRRQAAATLGQLAGGRP